VKSVESAILEHANQILEAAAADIAPDENRTDTRLSLLEVVSSEYAKWSINEYWSASFATCNLTDIGIATEWAKRVLTAINATSIPVPFALSALSRETLTPTEQRTSGAYYTDWRLAQLLAAQAVPAVTREGLWVDPACGTGMLLVATVLSVSTQTDRDQIIRHKLTGADLSRRALRGTLLSVASLTQDMAAIADFASRLLLQDSLKSNATWLHLAPKGVALAIANPPWERLRVSRHETALSAGEARNYGQPFRTNVDVEGERETILQYVAEVAAGTRLQGPGDYDLYKLFIELNIGLAAPNGVLAMLVPAGLIRAHGTAALRQELDDVASTLSISVIENRARHFAIDTRFKFVALVAHIGTADKQPIQLRVADRTGALPPRAVSIDRNQLIQLRPDRSLPEVRSTNEWDLFARLTRESKTVGDPSGPWHPSYRREVDMTSDQRHFKRGSGPLRLPVLEGRHVHQFRWRAKTYISGEGRAAIWNAEPIATARVRTQWHIPVSALRSESYQRVQESRIGFCDITGQTNERSLLVARIPADYVCGNKVPTLSFAQGGTDREDLFVALANSFVVDWMLRRVVTTSVNFFLLNSLPLPRIDDQGIIGRELILLARKLSNAEGRRSTRVTEVAHWRARVDALVAVAWGLNLDDLALVMNDFPLLDRGQPILPGERLSTVTRDAVLSALASQMGMPHSSTNRYTAATARGAIPYIGAEYV
jgi:hypothetical protein